MSRRRLSPDALAIVQGVWASRLRVAPDFWEGSTRRLAPRPDLDAVVAVSLGGVVIAVGPEWALASIAHLRGPELLDLDAVVDALAEHRPRPLGVATLAYAEAAAPTTTPGASTRVASTSDVDAVLALCPTTDRAESGLGGESAAVFVACSASGAPAALAGYEVWDGAIAHLGVLVAPEHRDEGLGRQVATAAVHRALAAGLLPQWRARHANAASVAVRDALGFIEVGAQLAVAVEPELG